MTFAQVVTTLVCVVLVGVLLTRLFFQRRVRLLTPQDVSMSESNVTGLPRATYSSDAVSIPLAIVMLLVVWWAIHRFLQTYHHQTFLTWMFNVMFCLVVGQLILAFLNQPTHYGAKDALAKKVAILVPMYNEDPQVLKAVLDSMFHQSKLPSEIYVVDDGSTDQTAYSDVQRWFLSKLRSTGVAGGWTRTENHGKRHAQVVGFRMIVESEIFITVDSDSLLDSRAVEQILMPFYDIRVQAVAGVILALNNRVNLLAKVTDLLFVTQQLTDRSSMSRLGSVLVNSGGLAAYRHEVLEQNMEEYMQESYFGRHVVFSDDSMLTLFALRLGRTVQQETAFAFAMMPETMSHHYRQQIRWFRGSFIRGLWRVKFLPIVSWGFWRQVLGWIQLLVVIVTVPYIVVWRPIFDHVAFPFEAVLVPVALSYAMAVRYMSIVRTDVRRSEQWTIFLLAPFISFWQNFFLRPLRLWGALSSRRTGWNTRTYVEVTLANELRRE